MYLQNKNKTILNSNILPKIYTSAPLSNSEMSHTKKVYFYLCVILDSSEDTLE